MADGKRTDSMAARTTSMRGRTVTDAADRRTLTASIRPGDRTRGLTPNPADHVRAKALRTALLVERSLIEGMALAGRR